MPQRMGPSAAEVQVDSNQTQHAHRPALLFAFANDDRPGRRLDGLRREIEQIRRTLGPAERRGLCEVLVRESTTPDELVEVLEDPRYRRRLALIHFAGHASESRLLLEGDGAPVAARIQGLAPMLCELESLEVLFLNGCATAGQGRRLVQAGIPAVIATEHTVEDARAERFAVGFYRSLASGSSISVAFERSCAQARCFVPIAGPSRDLALAARTEQPDEPWRLILAEPRGDTKDWSLPAAANDPLFGLPSPAGGKLPQEPFMGLRRFTASDAPVFFGRGWAIRNLYQDVLSPLMPPILVVYGASGVGKSSLLEAGLLPRVAATHEAHQLRLERKQDPLELLRRTLGATGTRMNLADAWRARERARGRSMVICMDQLEVLMLDQGGGKDELARFIRALESLYGDEQPRGKLLLSLRKEWFPELRRELQRHEMAWHEHFVEPLDRADIEEVVRGATRTASMRARYGITLDEDLAERIADDLSRDRGSAIAPMLQILLTRMWARAEPEVTSSDGRLCRHFSEELYDELRRDGLGLGEFVDRQLEELRSTHADELESGLALDILYRHTTSRGTAAVRTHVDLRESYAHVRQSMESLVDRFISLYLLQPVAGESEAEDGIRLAHDTLAPIIRDRHRCSRAPGQAAARLLETRIGMADSSERSRPFDEHDLEEVETAWSGMRRWTEDEQALVAKSRRRRTRAAWARVGRWVLVVGLLVALLVVYVLQKLEQEPDAEVVRTMMSISPARTPSSDEATSAHPPLLTASPDDANPAHSPSFASPTEGVAPAPATSASRAECVTRRLPTGLTGRTAGIEMVAATASGSRVALGMKERNKAFVFVPVGADRSDLEPIATRHPVNQVAWSSDEQYLGIGQERGAVHLVRWDDEVREPLECAGHSTSVRALRFSRDGTLLVTADDDGHVIVRDSQTCTPRGKISLDGRIEVLHEGLDSTWLAAGSEGRWVAWVGSDPSSAIAKGSLESRDPIRQASSGSDGQWVLAAGKRLHTWDGSSTTMQQSPDESTFVIRWTLPLSMSPSMNAKSILTASRRSVASWSLEAGAWKIARSNLLQAEKISGIAASQGGHDVFVADSTGNVHWLRPMADEPKAGVLEISSLALTALAADPYRRYVVAGDQNGDVMTITLPAEPRGVVHCEPAQVD